MEEAIRHVEEKEGIRVTWNAWTPSKAEASKSVIPMACCYKPLYRDVEEVPLVNYDPVRCAKTECSSVMNPYSGVDFRAKQWHCVFCGKMNPLPEEYRDISQDNLPYELFGENTTVFYRLSRTTPNPHLFFFVIDACSFDEERHAMLKEGLLTALEAIPDGALIGVVRYSANVELYELGRSDLAHIHVFPSTKYSYQVLQKSLSSSGALSSAALLAKFTARKKDCRQYVESLFKNFPVNNFPVSSMERPRRATGSAVMIAGSFVTGACPEGMGHLMLFTQGPCTDGPGAIASTNLREPIRSGGSTLMKFFAKESIYDEVAAELGKKGHSFDIVITTIDEVGYAEMRSLTEKTGGMAIISKDFNKEIYEESIKRMFLQKEGVLERVFDGKTRLLSSKGFKLVDIYGQGVNDGTFWRNGSLFPRSTLLFKLDQIEDVSPGVTGHIQIITRFVDSAGVYYERVSTFARSFVEGPVSKAVHGFDQEAACLFKARELCKNADGGDGSDVIRQADRSLIKFLQRFCRFDKDVPSSLKLTPPLAFFPEFIFFLRRLPALNTEGLSLDEVAYHRTGLLSEDVKSTMCIIKPTLISYTYSGEREPVELDSRSLKEDAILLLDTFHDVLIWRGSKIAAWIAEGFRENPEYWYFKEALDTVEEEAKALVSERLPRPKMTICDQYGSQERILLCKVNPSSSVANKAMGEGQVIVTEDIDFGRFYDFLARLVVSI
jgi:protein transport protein SEC23